MPPFNFRELEEKVSSASNLDAAWAAFLNAPENFQHGEAADVVSSLTAFSIVSRFSEYEAAEQQNLGAALNWAARVALFSTPDQDTEARYGIQQTREKVGDWLRSLPWALRKRQMPEMVTLALSALTQSNWKQGCWLLSSIGWRDERAVQALRMASLGQQTEKGDLLFCTLLDLGIPENESVPYLNEAHERYRARKSRPNMHSIYLLADASSLRVLGESLPKGDKTEDDKMAWLFLPQTIAHIANRHNTEKVGSQAIDLLGRLLSNHGAQLKRGIYLGGAVVSKCNSRKAVRFILDLITRELKSQSQHDLMLLVRRAEECVASNQVRALNLSRNGSKLKQLFSSVLTQVNEYKGRDLTFEADVKDHVWNLCLTVGTKNADKIGSAFIEADQNPYTQFKVLSDLACLALHPLPSRVISWASSPAPPQSANPGTDELQRMEAIRVVASAGTIESFNVLLHSQYITSHGHTLADSADGLAYLAVVLARDVDHKHYVVEELFKVLDQGPKGPQPGAVTSAISDLAYVGLLEEQHYQQIIQYLLTPTDWIEKPVVKSRLVAALSSAPVSLMTDELIRKLESWSELPDRLLATSCLETLIRQGFFVRHVELLGRRLRFAKSDSTPNLLPQETGDVNGGIYALLAYSEPARYQADFATFLQTCAFGSFVEAMETLARLQSKGTAWTSIPPAWAEALIKRAIQNNTRYNSESHIFVFLGKYSPTLLASTNWTESFSNWMPETREALAVALGHVASDSESSDRATQTLADLQNDTHFGVRRAAFRSLGRVSPSFLATMVKSLAFSESPDNRKLATEAIYWIPIQLRSKARWKQITQRLREDAAEDVRDSLWISEQRSRKITYAQKYQEELTGSVLRSNCEILRLWKYAEAISHVGDDETAAKLSTFLRSNNLPANFQRFLIRAIEKLQKNWEKSRQKWPEPFAPGSAATKTGEGRLIIDHEIYPIRYLIWYRIDILQPTILSWGGTGVATTLPKRLLRDQKFMLTDSEGLDWDVWIDSYSPPSHFSFVGGDRVTPVSS